MSLVRIKIITYGNFPYGGACANYLRNMSILLAKKYDTEVLLATGYSFGEIENLDNQRVGMLKNVKYRYLSYLNRPNFLLGKFFDVFYVNLTLLYSLVIIGIKRDADIIIKYNISFFNNLSLLFICRVFKIKLINILPEFHPKPKRSLITLCKWSAFYLGITYLSRFSDGIIAFSKYLVEYVSKHKYSGPILLTPNIVDPDFFKVKAKPYKNGCITIGYTGRPTVKDGIDDLLKSFALVKLHFNNVHLLIIGDTPNKSSIPSLKVKANSLGIDGFVTFKGLVSFKEIPKHLNACEILILTRPKSIQSEVD